MAQQYLRNIVACLDVPAPCVPEVFAFPSDEFFDGDGTIDQNSREFLQH
jgi:hypothetical protein